MLHTAVLRRHTYLRPQLVQVGAGPWLRPMPVGTRSWGRVFLLGLILALGFEMRFTRWWVLIGSLCWLTWVGARGLANLLRADIQVCPRCLEPTALGATRCPHCCFDDGSLP
jgi:hypothetical protein